MIKSSLVYQEIYNKLKSIHGEFVCVFCFVYEYVVCILSIQVQKKLITCPIFSLFVRRVIRETYCFIITTPFENYLLLIYPSRIIHMYIVYLNSQGPLSKIKKLFYSKLHYLIINNFSIHGPWCVYYVYLIEQQY